MDLLASIAECFALPEDFSQLELSQKLSQISRQYVFIRMGVALPDDAYTTDNEILQVGQREYFTRSMEGESCISASLEDMKSGELISVQRSYLQRQRSERCTVCNL